ncbi:MAG: PQQ-binding-like beta-propeller repeat protein [Candidatus Bathyarchaeia archaeon]
MPLFGKRQEAREPAPIIKPIFRKFREYWVPGTPTGLAFCNIQGKDGLIMSAMNARGLTAMTVEGEKLWTFDTGGTVFSLATANFGGQRVILAGSQAKVFAISESGHELWQYQMPETGSKITKLTLSAGRFTQTSAKRYGYNDVYRLTPGKFEGEDAVLAVAGWQYAYEGPQIISSKGEQICALKRKALGKQYGLLILATLIDFSPRGDAVLAVVSEVSFSIMKEVSVIKKDGTIEKKLKFKIYHAPKDTYVKGGFQDKYRGKLVGGKFGETDVCVLGTPDTRSVAAISLDGDQLWNYETAYANDINAGINDIALGSILGQPVAVIGTFNHYLHIVTKDGRRLEMWAYPTNITDVAVGKIGEKDAIAVGLYNGQVFTYTAEHS